MFYFHLHDNESSGRRQGTCSSGKSKVSDSKASVTARNNKDDRKVNVFASGADGGGGGGGEG